MTNETSENKKLDQLRDVLDTYGANMDRWPEEIRADLERFVAQDDHAAKLIGEEDAFDTVLSSVSSGQVENADAISRQILNALDDRIPAPEHEAKGHEVDDNETTGNVVSFQPKRPRVKRTMEPLRAYPELGLLAASLVIGVWIGSSGALDTSVTALRSVAGFEQMERELSGPDTLLSVLFDEDGNVKTEDEVL